MLRVVVVFLYLATSILCVCPTSGCPSGQWCRDCTDADGPRSDCVNFVQQGGQCGGHVAACNRTQCAEGLSCQGPALAYDGFGNCLPENQTGCPANGCPSGQWCRECTNSNGPMSECVDFVQEGGQCGGHVAACYQTQCAEGLSCQGDALAYDGPGTCLPENQTGCSANGCPSGQWCRECTDSNGPVSECVDFVQEGGQCGGFVAPCYQSRCAEGLSCQGDAQAADRPGTCLPENPTGCCYKKTASGNYWVYSDFRTTTKSRCKDEFSTESCDVVKARTDKEDQCPCKKQGAPLKLCPDGKHYQGPGRCVKTAKGDCVQEVLTCPRCQLPPDSGLCKGAFPRYYYNYATQSCEQFIWGGCGGNANRFSTLEECQAACSTVKDGNCPSTSDSFGICSSNCETDGDCDGKKKCCSNGCAQVCTNPTRCPPGHPEVECVKDPCQGAKCDSNPEAKCVSNYCGGCNADWYVDGKQVKCKDEKPKKCPGGSDPVNCLVDPCANAKCEAHPDATCVANYCGGCNADWYLNGKKVSCKASKKPKKCPDGSNPVNCFADPCSVSKCDAHPEATCVSDYCGGCNARWYVDGKQVTCSGCPDGSQPVNCFMNPCTRATCPAHPDATCVANYCGGCNADWYVNGNKVSCTASKQVTCRDGSRPVNCFVDPCMVSTCPAYPTAVCVSDYCGGCNAIWTIDGKRVKCGTAPSKVKSGMCPVLSSNAVGICLDGCSSDSDCKGAQKCCYNGCGRVCVDPQPTKGCCYSVGYGTMNVPSYSGFQDVSESECNVETRIGGATVYESLTCAAVQARQASEDQCKCTKVDPTTCPDGTKQKLGRCAWDESSKTCVQETRPCPLVAIDGKCPDVTGMMGDCAERCNSDKSCKDNELCCKNGCGTVCVPNIVSTDTTNGGVTTKSKVGVCPTVEPGTIGNCLEACTSDENCTGSDKCCSNGCGHSCVAPVETPKKGKCPAPTGMGVCVDGCSKDKDCSGDQKCCSNGCGRVCTAPDDEPKAGTCPVPTGMGICLDGCSSDSDCSGDQKCCSNGCGRVCTSPASSLVSQLQECLKTSDKLACVAKLYTSTKEPASKLSLPQLAELNQKAPDVTMSECVNSKVNNCITQSEDIVKSGGVDATQANVALWRAAAKYASFQLVNCMKGSNGPVPPTAPSVPSDDGKVSKGNAGNNAASGTSPVSSGNTGSVAPAPPAGPSDAKGNGNTLPGNAGAGVPAPAPVPAPLPEPGRPAVDPVEPALPVEDDSDDSSSEESDELVDNNQETYDDICRTRARATFMGLVGTPGLDIDTVDSALLQGARLNAAELVMGCKNGNCMEIARSILLSSGVDVGDVEAQLKLGQQTLIYEKTVACKLAMSSPILSALLPETEKNCEAIVAKEAGASLEEFAKSLLVGANAALNDIFACCKSQKHSSDDCSSLAAEFAATRDSASPVLSLLTTSDLDRSLQQLYKLADRTKSLRSLSIADRKNIIANLKSQVFVTPGQLRAFINPKLPPLDARGASLLLKRNATYGSIFVLDEAGPNVVAVEISMVDVNDVLTELGGILPPSPDTSHWATDAIVVTRYDKEGNVISDAPFSFILGGPASSLQVWRFRDFTDDELNPVDAMPLNKLGWYRIKSERTSVFVGSVTTADGDDQFTAKDAGIICGIVVGVLLLGIIGIFGLTYLRKRSIFSNIGSLPKKEVTVVMEPFEFYQPVEGVDGSPTEMEKVIP